MCINFMIQWTHDAQNVVWVKKATNETEGILIL
jgi:hypothetical protein